MTNERGNRWRKHWRLAKENRDSWSIKIKFWRITMMKRFFFLLSNSNLQSSWHIVFTYPYQRQLQVSNFPIPKQHDVVADQRIRQEWARPTRLVSLKLDILTSSDARLEERRRPVVRLDLRTSCELVLRWNSLLDTHNLLDSRMSHYQSQDVRLVLAQAMRYSVMGFCWMEKIQKTNVYSSFYYAVTIQEKKWKLIELMLNIKQKKDLQSRSFDVKRERENIYWEPNHAQCSPFKCQFPRHYYQHDWASFMDHVDLSSRSWRFSRLSKHEKLNFIQNTSHFSLQLNPRKATAHEFFLFTNSMYINGFEMNTEQIPNSVPEMLCKSRMIWFFSLDIQNLFTFHRENLSRWNKEGGSWYMKSRDHHSRLSMQKNKHCDIKLHVHTRI